MRFETIRLNPIDKYAFVIGTRDKPDNALKEWIRSQIGEAMASLGFPPDSYSVTINRGDKLEEEGEREYPSLTAGADYLIFGIINRGDSAESFSDREIEESREELAKAIFPPEGSRIALVILRDSTVSLLITKGVPVVVVKGISYAERTVRRYR